jgi:hypothetical protein
VKRPQPAPRYQCQTHFPACTTTEPAQPSFSFMSMVKGISKPEKTSRSRTV